MADAPTYDIVIVTYNSAARIPACLTALRRLLPLERGRVIAVDNASSDGSAEAVESLEPSAAVVRNDVNAGFAKAVNQALRLGTAELILLLNPDVLDVRGDLAEVERLFAEDRVAAVATLMIDECGELRRSCHLEPSPFTLLSENLALHERFPSWRAARAYRMLGWDMRSARDVEDACGGFLVLSRRAVEEVGLLDERFFLYCEETDWMRRARRLGWRVVFTPALEAVHAGGKSSEMPEEAMSAHLLRSQYRYLRKHFGILAETSTRVTFAALDLLRASVLLVPGRTERRRASAREAARRLRLHLGRGRHG